MTGVQTCALPIFDGEEDSSGGVRDDIVGDERAFGTPNLGLVQDVDPLLEMLLHSGRVGGIPTSEPLHRDWEERSVEVEGLVGHVHEHAETDLGDGIENARVNAVPLSVNVRSALGDVESSDVSLVGPASGIWDGVKFLGVVAEVVLVVVAGWDVLVEFVTGDADKRRSHEGLDVESREVLRVVVWVLALEVTASIDVLENRLAVGVLAVGGATELPIITVDDNSGMTGSAVVSIENEGLENFQVLDDESTIFKDCLGVTISSVRRKLSA